MAYYMPDCAICLFSPQSYFNLHGGDATVTARSVEMRLPNTHVVDIPINATVNLPVIHCPQPTLEEQDKFGPHLLSSVVANTLHLAGLVKPVCCKMVAETMKASGMRSDLRLQRNALLLATVGSLRQSKLLSLSLLYSLLVHPCLNLLQVPWS